MRMNSRSRLLINVCGYFGALAIVIVGGVYGAHALLSTVPQPTFLVPEYLLAGDFSQDNRAQAEPAPDVQVVPYRPPPALQSTWKSSIARAYVAAPPQKSVETKEIRKAPKKAKSSNRKGRKQNREAMDAFASQ